MRQQRAFLPEYIQEVRKTWKAFTVSLVPSAAAFLADYYAKHWLGATSGYKDVVPAWLPWLLMFLGLSYVQYRLWLAEKLKQKTLKLTITRGDYWLADYYGDGITEWTDPLLVELDFMLRNEGEACRSFYPVPRLFRRRGRSRWEEIGTKVVARSGGARLRDTGRRIGTKWIGDLRLEIPAQDELRVNISFILIPEDGAASILNRDLKLLVPLDVPGMTTPPLLEAYPPRIADYRWRKPLAADPAPSTLRVHSNSSDTEP